MCAPSTTSGYCGKPYFSKNKEEDSLTSSTVRGSLMHLSARWLEIAFVTHRMIIDTILLAIPNAFAVFLIFPSSERQYIVKETCISTEVGFGNLAVILFMYWWSFLHKTSNDCFDVWNFSFYSSATNSSLTNRSHHCFVHPGRIQYPRLFLSHFFFSLEVTSKPHVCWFFFSRYYSKVCVAWLELNSRDFVKLECNK